MSLYRDEHNTREAIVQLERALRTDPSNAEAHLLLGQIYGSAELYDRAEPELRRAVELFVPLAADDPEKIARLLEARNSLAAALINLQRPAEAIPLLRLVIDDVHYPSQHLALGNLGQAHLALRQYRQAAEALERAIRARPDFCVGHYRLGEAYFNLEEHTRALEALDRVLNNGPEGCNRIQPAFLVRGQVRARLHQTDAAREDFTRCRDMDPRSTAGQQCAQLLRTAESP